MTDRVYRETEQRDVTSAELRDAIEAEQRPVATPDEMVTLFTAANVLKRLGYRATEESLRTIHNAHAAHHERRRRAR